MPTPFKALSDLLLSSFTPAELSEILRAQGKDNLRYAVAWSNSPATVIADLVDGLRRFGEADQDFFQALVERRGTKVEQIRLVASLWIGEQAARQLNAPARVEASRVEQAQAVAPPVAQPIRPDRGEPLVIRHQRGAEKPFGVFVGRTQVYQAALTDPADWQVPGMKENLAGSLRWLLEEAYKSDKDESGAVSAVTKALRAWGEHAYAALFADPNAGRHYLTLRDAGAVDVRVTSDDPAVMAWPWEAVRDPQTFEWGISNNVRISRFVDKAPDLPRNPRPLAARVHVLVLSARPQERDVDSRAVVGPLLESLYSHEGPAVADVTLLRPPTLEALQAELISKPGHYTAVHFDTHGEIVDGEGALLLENDEYGVDKVPASVLGATLLKLNVSLVVLNACRSGAMAGSSVDTFAAVASSLLRAGVGAVVAMSYNLLVEGARQFVPAFYASLLQTGDAIGAAQTGRLHMAQRSSRSGYAKSLNLPDWVLPVVYENRPELIPFQPGGERLSPFPPLPRERAHPLRAGGVLGRGDDLLWLERMSLSVRPALVLTGPAGVGKSALLRSFLIDLHRSGGLTAEPVWVEGANHRDLSAALVSVAVGVGLRSASEPGGRDELQPKEVERLTELLREQGRLVVLDDVHRMEPPDGSSSPGVVYLNSLLQGLLGGKARILLSARAEITSLRSDLRSLRKVRPLADDVCAALLAEQIREAGLPCFPGQSDVVALARRVLGLPGLIMGIGSHLSSRAELQIASERLEVRRDLIEQGEIDRVIAEVVKGL